MNLSFFTDQDIANIQREMEDLKKNYQEGNLSQEELSSRLIKLQETSNEIKKQQQGLNNLKQDLLDWKSSPVKGLGRVIR